MKTTQAIAVVFMFLFCGINLRAQEKYYKTYSVNDGLLSSDNYMTIQDSKGYMWICSSKGLTKFDGKNFTYFTVKNGLPTNDIWYIKEDSKQRIWLGGYFKGLYYIQNDSVIKLKIKEEDSRVLLNTEFNDTLLFCPLDYKNYYLNSNNLEEYKVDKVDYHKIRDSSNLIEINYIPNSTFQDVKLLKYKSRLDVDQITIDFSSLLFNNDKQFMISIDRNKMVLYSDSAIKIIDVKDYLGGVISEIKTITPSKEVMIKIDDTIKVYKDLLTLERNREMEAKLAPFKSTRIGWITMDNEKNLWITEYRSSLIFIPFNNQNIIRSNIEDKEDGNNIFNITQIKDQVFFNSLTGNLYNYSIDNQNIKKIKNRNFNIFGDDILFVNRYKNQMFYNKKSEIFLLKNKKYVKFKTIDEVEYISPRCMIFKNDSIVMTGDFEEFAIRNNELHLLNDNSFVVGKISTIIETENHYISGGTRGLYFLNKSDNQKFSYPIKGVQSLKELNELLIVGTNDNGMLLMDYEGNIIIEKHVGLSINDIEIQGDLIYLATNKGIIIEKFLNNRFETVKYISNSDGLTSDEVNSIAINDSLLFAGTVDGFNQINLKAILKEKGSAPKVYLTSFIVNDSLSKMNNTSLNYNENNISINYTGISFHSLGEITYSHRLLGLGDNWNFTTENNVKYWSLPSGDYTFEVKAFNSKGLESENSVKFQFSVGKHFTETWWFIGAILLSFLLFISWLFYQIQTRRTKKLLTEKKFADLELRALQSQMNPHFIFNSLNAIQSVMFLKGEKETNKYIGAFSKLMRLTLDNSKEGVITLENEIEYQQTYIDLEKRRLNGELNYSIDISEEINPEEIKIPSMIFQPLIENAIIHGLIPKKQNRNLEIRFSIEDELLVGTVTDNGVGREASLKKQKGKEYKSWASTILKEKVEVLNRLNQSNMEYIITDLEENNIPSGTKITVKLPLNYGN